MVDGIYSITFRGASDWGAGMLVLHRGTVTGADTAGVQYDGTYEVQGENLFLNMRMIVPPGVILVQGSRPQPKAYEVPIKTVIPKRVLTSAEPILIDLPPGPVNVIFQRLRELRD